MASAKKLLRVTDEDLTTLQEMTHWFRNSVVDKRPPEKINVPPLGPEVYVALPQSPDGIPAINRVGTSSIDSPSSGDMPGSGDCDIYQLIDGALIQCEFNKTIYNFSEQAIPKEWFFATRDKFGTWFAMPNLPTVYLGVADAHLYTGLPGTVERLNASLGFTGIKDTVTSPLGPVHMNAYVIYARSNIGLLALNTPCPVGTGT